MNDKSLSRLYRLVTAKRTAVEIDAEELVAAVSGEADVSGREAVASKLAVSPRHADLGRLLRALQPASAELAEGVRRRGSAHPSRHREAARPGHRMRVPHRPLRWAGGLAACLAVALGVVGIWHGRTGDLHRDGVASARTAQLPDRIFTSQDRIFASNDHREHPRKQRHGGDEVFRADFSAGG